MEPTHVFYKELPLDKSNIFSANLAENDEVEEIKLKKFKEYTVTGLSITHEVESDLVPVADLDAQNALSDLIRNYVKKKEEPNLALKIYNEEAFETIIPSKKRSDVAVKSFKYYDTTTKKQETVDFYDYFHHLERFSFEWEEVQLQFKYSVKLSNDKKKIIKKMSIDKQNRK